MGVAAQAAYFLLRPQQLRKVIQWKLWHEPVHPRNSKLDPPTQKSCFALLDLTSRSFAAVIKELHPELLMAVVVFYLALRGLDTIEDDMTLDINKKEKILRSFAELMEIDGWTFTESGPNEKDRELLVHFDDVIVEAKKLKPEYYAIVKDITIKMGNGMADYALNAEHNENGVMTTKDYELYCHYVAGLVGEGLTRLFVEANLANPKLMDKPDLTESMGQMLQKVNIIRDIREDFDDNRRFWPKEIWSKYFDKWEDIFKIENRQRAMHCSSEMVLNALQHADDCLFYMAGIKEQSVFNFVAIPQAMAIATLELVFNNPALFERNVKITKGDACGLMTESTQNLRVLCSVFRRYARRIHQKNDPRDPNFMAINVQCGKIERFIESIFPTQDVKQLEVEQALRQKNNSGPSMDTKEALFLIMTVLTVLVVIGGLMVAVAWGFGARFDKMFQSLDANMSAPPAETSAIPYRDEL